MSGFEILSMVCSVMQVISFTKEVLTLCKDVYEGRETNDGRMEENLTSLNVSLEEMNRYSGSTPSQTKYEKELYEMAQKCSKAAEKLQKEIQRITKYYESGDCMKSIIAIYMSKTRKRKIEALYDQFCQYQKMLETQILVHLCTKSDAIALQQRENFTELSDTMKYFISQLAAGHTDIANLIARDGVQTRQYIQHSETRMKQSIKKIQNDANKESKRARLLRSLKYESMNSRRTELKLAHEATYVSIFESLDIDEESHAAPTSSSAEAWRQFVHWLQSDIRVFWIQGKPGAGKSTLMKFLLQHKYTQKGVNKWRPNTLIVSHFFWKPGDILQKNLRGLLCSLIHQLLSSDHNLIDHILSRFPFATDKDTIGDWEISELESAFHSILIQCKRSTFFLIDGLDEAIETDEILRFLDSLTDLQSVKLCISSRSEDIFVQKFSKYDGLKLNELTENDMLQLVLIGIPEMNGYPSSFLEELRRLLVQKAEGVYLWLVIALESVKRGLRNSDKQHEIYLRLSKLPSKLEELYADMWDRLGEDKDIYQKDAARYFSLLIRSRSLCEQYEADGASDHSQWHLNPFHLMLATNEEIKTTMLDRSSRLSDVWLSCMCADIVKGISTKTAGLLIITQSAHIDGLDFVEAKEEFSLLSKHLLCKVDFIHRTLFDFFKESNVGRTILAQNQTYCTNVELGAIILCQLRTLRPERPRGELVYRTTGSLLHYYLWILNRLLAEDSAMSKKATMNLLHASCDLFEAGLLPWDDRPKWYPHPSFDSLIIKYPVFKEFIQSRIEKKGPSHATYLLREFLSNRYDYPLIDFDEKESILSLGGELNSVSICYYDVPEMIPGIFAVCENATLDFATYESILSLVIKKVHNAALRCIAVGCASMQNLLQVLRQGPDLDKHTSFVVSMESFGSSPFKLHLRKEIRLTADLLYTMISLEKTPEPKFRHYGFNQDRHAAFIIMEVNLKYLVEQIFDLLATYYKDEKRYFINCDSQSNKTASCKSYAKTLFLIRLDWDDTAELSSMACYRFINYNVDIRADSTIDFLSLPHSSRTIAPAQIDHYIKQCEKVDMSTLSILADEKLGVCRLKDVGIEPPS